MPTWTALVTLLALTFYFYTGFRVASARAKYRVQAPATTGHPDFERVFRVQMNTLEWMPIFLPALWLFAAYVSDIAAAIIGLIWIGGRTIYLLDYEKAAAKRGRGFGIQTVASAVLWIGALVGIVTRIVLGS
jgi:glutathione S-transferase